MNTGMELEYVGRLAGAALLGGVIGLEREMHGQAAGLRTHMVVCIGAALMMIVSIRMGDNYNSDRARIAAQVVTGIGFLGAGAIMRYGTTVRGLTTSACIWTAAGIGLAIGEGWYVGAIAGTAITSVTIYVFDYVERKFIGGKHLKRLSIKIKDQAGAVGRIEKELDRFDLFIKEVGIHKDVLEKKAEIRILATCPDKCDFDELSRTLSALKDVEQVDIE